MSKGTIHISTAYPGTARPDKQSFAVNNINKAFREYVQSALLWGYVRTNPASHPSLFTGDNGRSVITILAVGENKK